MEIYLCHMFVYRIFEKLNLIHISGNEIVNYSLIAVGTIAGAVVIALCYRKAQQLINNLKKHNGSFNKVSY